MHTEKPWHGDANALSAKPAERPSSKEVQDLVGSLLRSSIQQHPGVITFGMITTRRPKLRGSATAEYMY